MADNSENSRASTDRTIYLAARATLELFGHNAVAKTRERLGEVEAEGNEASVAYWRALLKEVTRLHKKWNKF